MLFSPAAIAFIAVAIVVLPVIQRPVVAAEILVLGIAAVAMNLLIGYTGMLSFGQAMFFGISAYITGILVTKAGVSAFVAIPVAVVATGVVAALVGAFCVRRSGLYFICITFAFNQMFYFIAYSWTSVTGGEDGLPGIARPAIIADPISFYVFTAAVFVAALAVLKKIVDSPTGRILQAIRDNPNRAAATGHDVGRYKLVAFVVAGAMGGLAGALLVNHTEFVTPEFMHWTRSGEIMFMVILGGMGTLVGPVLGAAMALGTVFALVVLFFRTGVIGVVEAGYERFRRQREKPANP
ncbi:MAG: branched-chain amino acid ABC transporter permease [Rhodospirillales bacterium]|nr:branched-chain amino acid ABC transporter permease [Rhodospirillales bacterium]